MPQAVPGCRWSAAPLLILILSGCPEAGPAPADAALPPDGTSVDLAWPDSTPADAAWSRPDGRSSAGLSCQSDWDCTAGLTCETTLPGGLCTRTCTADADCGGGALGCHEGRCQQRCNPRALINPCRKQYVCRIDGATAFCVPDCRDLLCAAGWICDANSGLCVDPSSGGIGDPCGVKEGACDGTPNGVCFALTTFGGGFCTVPCAPFTKPCPTQLANTQCLVGPQTAPYCAFICDPAAPQCPNPALSCQGPLGGGYHVCLP